MMHSTPGPGAWRTVDIVVAAVISVAFGVVFVAWNAMWSFTTPLFTAVPAAQAIIYGVWLLPGVFVGLVVRRPGAALFAGILSASVSALIGSQWGADAVLSGALQGGGAELAFAAFLYRRWTLAVSVLAGVLAAAGAALHDIPIYYAELGVAYWAVYAAAAMLSGAIVAGIGAWYLVRALAASGALGDFAAGREQPEV